jgi:hypothetical protein
MAREKSSAPPGGRALFFFLKEGKSPMDETCCGIQPRVLSFSCRNFLAGLRKAPPQELNGCAAFAAVFGLQPEMFLDETNPYSILYIK